MAIGSVLLVITTGFMSLYYVKIVPLYEYEQPNVHHTVVSLAINKRSILSAFRGSAV